MGVKYCLPVNRGRTAIELALRALQLERGDEVVLPSYVCQSVLDAVIAAGSEPVFADVGADLNVTPETVQRALTAKTKCVIVPHLFGKAAPIVEIEARLRGKGIALIDDAAQSFGAQHSGRLLGTFGTCGIVSCGPGKSLAGCAGGLLVTNDAALFERAAAIGLDREGSLQVVSRTLKFWFWRRFRRLTLPLGLLFHRFLPTETAPSVLVNAPLSNLEAGLMLAQFRALRKNRDNRRNNAARLLAALGKASSLAIPNLSDAEMSLKLVLTLPSRGPTAAESVELLRGAGIECEVGYRPLHLDKKGFLATSPSVTESLWERVLCMPIELALKDIAGLARLSPALTTEHRRLPIADYQSQGSKPEPVLTSTVGGRAGNRGRKLG